jgi:hypothetical protein
MRVVHKTDGLIKRHRRIEVGDRQAYENHFWHDV